MSQEFRDKLIGAETENQSARAEYEKRLAAMLEGPLEWPRRAGLMFAALVSVATVVLSAVLAVRFRHGPAVMLEGFALGGAFGIVGAIIAGRILWRGTYRHRRDSTAQANLIWIFVVLLEVIFMEADGLYPQDGLRMTVFGMVFLIGAAVMLLRTVIEQSELRTREKLLETQYEIAELKESLGRIAR